MKFLVMIHVDQSRLEALPAGEYDAMMQGCILKADALKAAGVLLDSQQLEGPETAKTLRVQDGRVGLVDGPYAETKEFFGGFNLIEARDHDEAMRIAAEFPWTRIGAIEVRPVRDFDAVRRRVGA
ncbi:MAG: YciI family protein [Xanthomonadales bacterium]|nr:YciI family protein [Xanthomonadales bacterium]